MFKTADTMLSYKFVLRCLNPISLYKACVIILDISQLFFTLALMSRVTGVNLSIFEHLI